MTLGLTDSLDEFNSDKASWSDIISKCLPYKYRYNFVSAQTTAKASLSVTVYHVSRGNSFLLT